MLKKKISTKHIFDISFWFYFTNQAIYIILTHRSKVTEEEEATGWTGDVYEGEDYQDTPDTVYQAAGFDEGFRRKNCILQFWKFSITFCTYVVSLFILSCFIFPRHKSNGIRFKSTVIYSIVMISSISLTRNIIIPISFLIYETSHI